MKRQPSIFAPIETTTLCRRKLEEGDLVAHVLVDHFQGHAYGLADRRQGRRCVDAGALLIGDAAGLAAVQSGEGILPAIQFMAVASATIFIYRYFTRGS